MLAIMSSTLPMILSPTPMDWNTSFPMPYTADRFVIEANSLRRIAPPYESFDAYVAALNDPAAWADRGTVRSHGSVLRSVPRPANLAR